MALRCFVWVNSFSATQFYLSIGRRGARPPAEFCLKNKKGNSHSELVSESSAFDFAGFLKSLDAETIPDQVRDSMTCLWVIL